MNTSPQRRLLVIGATSKIARHFISSCPDTYEIYGTYNEKPVNLIPKSRQLQLDLCDNDAISAFLNQLSSISFDTILFFASTYVPDPDNSDDYFTAYQKDLQINAACTVRIVSGLRLADGAKVFLFGDAGLKHPKKGFTSYSISKLALADVARLLAVELAPRVATFCLQLGPTLQDTTKQSEAYYDRCLIKVQQPVKGLVNLLHFLIAEDNFNATGCVINYDGGAYLRRP